MVGRLEEGTDREDLAAGTGAAGDDPEAGGRRITHPFHPLRGQRFVVLKVRTVSGVETLSLRQAELGSFAVAREWTDWAPPGAQAVPSDGKALLIDASGLLALDQLVASLTHTVKLDQ